MADDKKQLLEFKHCIGNSIQLQFYPGNEDDRHYVRFLGFQQGKSIIVTTPRVDGVALRVDNEQKFIVRMVSGNSAKGFTSTTIHSTSRPYPHLHLTYPETLESITVRKAERIECSLIVSVQNEMPGKMDQEGISASMDNISTAGAQLTTPEIIGDVGDDISITCKVNVAAMPQYLNISGVIRRHNVHGDKNQFGIEFLMPENHDKLVLHAFIYEQMLSINE